MWWLLIPARWITCRLISALKAKARKNSSNNSVSISPILGRSNTTLQAKKGRPEKSTTASASVSSIGIVACPKRRMPRLSPTACRKACPSTMPTSSVVWWKSMWRSPTAFTVRSNSPCRAKAVSRWSRKPMPVAMSALPDPSRSSVSAISVSEVVRVRETMRGMMPLPYSGQRFRSSEGYRSVRVGGMRRGERRAFPIDRARLYIMIS